MALIICPECGKEVSDKAEKCPNCAYPFITEKSKEEKTEKQTRNNRWIVPVAIIAAIVLLAGTVTLIVLRGTDPVTDPAMAEEGTNVNDKSLSSEQEKVKPNVSTQKKSGTIEEILAADVEASLSPIREKYENITAESNILRSYKDDTDLVLEWYDLSVAQFTELCAQISGDCYAYLADQEEILGSETMEFSNVRRIIYDEWEEALDDFFDPWETMFDDLYDRLDDILEDAYDNASNDKKEDVIGDLWDDADEAYDKTWNAMSDLYDDAYDEVWNIRSTEMAADWDAAWGSLNDILS